MLASRLAYLETRDAAPLLSCCCCWPTRSISSQQLQQRLVCAPKSEGNLLKLDSSHLSLFVGLLQFRPRRRQQHNNNNNNNERDRAIELRLALAAGCCTRRWRQFDLASSRAQAAVQEHRQQHRPAAVDRPADLISLGSPARAENGLFSCATRCWPGRLLFGQGK